MENLTNVGLLWVLIETFSRRAVVSEWNGLIFQRKSKNISGNRVISKGKTSDCRKNISLFSRVWRIL